MKPLSDLIKVLPDAKVEEVGKCEKCNKSKYIIDDVEVGCDCNLIEESINDIRKQKAIAFDKQSVITNSYRQKRLRDYNAVTDEQKRAKQVAVDYITNFKTHLEKGNNLLFLGTFGTGKTHIAASIRNELARQNYKVYYTSFPEYLDRIKSEFNSNEISDQYKIKRMMSECELLVIDDIGANRLTGFAIDELFRITDARSGKCTIYTTNLNESDFESNYDLQRVYSRMLENTKLLKVVGKDYRREQADDY